MRTNTRLPPNRVARRMRSALTQVWFCSSDVKHASEVRTNAHLLGASIPELLADTNKYFNMDSIAFKVNYINRKLCLRTQIKLMLYNTTTDWLTAVNIAV